MTTSFTPRYQRAGIAGLAALATATALFGCAVDESKDPSGAGAASSLELEGECPTVDGVTDNSISFGTSLPLSGSAATEGASAKAALDAWIEMTNDAGGINGRKIELIAQDDAFDPQKGATNVQYLLQEKKVFAIWGPLGSGTTSAELPVVTSADGLFLFPNSFAKSMSQPLNSHAFTLIPPNDVQMEAMSGLLSELGDEYVDSSFGFLVPNTGDGQETADSFAKGELGDQLKSTQAYDPTATTVKPQLQALRDAGVDVVYALTSASVLAKTLKEAQEIGLDAQFIASGGNPGSAAVIELAGDLAEGQLALGLTALGSDSGPGVDEFNKQMAERAPDMKNLGQPAVHAWLSGVVLGHALEELGDCVTMERLRYVLESTKNFDTGGLSGPISFSAEDHVGNKSVRLYEVVDGKWQAASDYYNHQ